MTNPTIGVVGVGRMGANMAGRLKACGFSISAVYDANQDTAQKLATELESHASETLADVTQRSDVILTIVSDDAAMNEIYYATPDNLLHNANGKLFMNFATLTPSIHITLKQNAENVGANTLECPMASSITQALEGSLYLMCAGEKTIFEHAQPILQALSKTALYTGEAGSAAKLKALVNMVMNINTAALAEGLGLADALGLDLNLVRTVFAQTGANSRVLKTDGEDMQNRDHATYFSAAHAAKDSGIALRLGEELGLEMQLTKVTQVLYQQMIDHGLGELDKSGISELTFKNRRPEALLQKV